MDENCLEVHMGENICAFNHPSCGEAILFICCTCRLFRI